MKRTDIHRPSAINPDDYQYVAEEFMAVNSLGDALCLKAQRDIIAAHRARTGGNYSGHEHGGNCMVCGSVNALYTSLFYHEGTNSYVRMGHDCADKCACGGEFARKQFRRQVEDARERKAGKQKALAILESAGHGQAWWFYEHVNELPAGRLPYEEATIIDIVAKLVKYGSVSEKALGFVGQLLKKIEARPALEAKKAEEHAKAADCPSGRVVIEGRLLATRVDEGPYGSVTKMLVQAESGFKVWGTLSSALYNQGAEKGDTVRFEAMVEPSKDDPKFGFFKRPTKAAVVSKGWVAPTFEVVVTLEPEVIEERNEEGWSLAADMLDAQHGTEAV